MLFAIFLWTLMNFDAIFCDGEHYIYESKKINDMKKKNVFLIMLMLAIASILLISCDKDNKTLDGDWPRMQWDNQNGLENIDNVYQIPASGGTYKMVCKNYGTFWINGIKEDDTVLITSLEADNFMDIKGSWSRAQSVNGELILTIDPLYEATESRQLEVYLESGDAFYTFHFLQKKNSN